MTIGVPPLEFKRMFSCRLDLVHLVLSMTVAHIRYSVFHLAQQQTLRSCLRHCFQLGAYSVNCHATISAISRPFMYQKASRTDNDQRPRYRLLRTQTAPRTPYKRLAIDRTISVPHSPHTSPPNAAIYLSNSCSTFISKQSTLSHQQQRNSPIHTRKPSLTGPSVMTSTNPPLFHHVQMSLEIQ